MIPCPPLSSSGPNVSLGLRRQGSVDVFRAELELRFHIFLQEPRRTCPLVTVSVALSDYSQSDSTSYTKQLAVLVFTPHWYRFVILFAISLPASPLSCESSTLYKVI